jgi:NAD-dependent SIR2 family protein deacetylase
MDLDKVMTCIECKETFNWSVEEQGVFHEKGMRRPPKRCASCEQERRRRRSEFGLGGTKARISGGRW